jgi:hypothetical protein
VFLWDVQLRVALGNSVELGMRSRYAQLAYICYQAIPADDEVSIDRIDRIPWTVRLIRGLLNFHGFMPQ